MAGIMRICFYLLLIAAVNLNALYAIDNSNTDNNPKPLEIISITPTGEDVPAGRQITFKFNKRVVKVGRMERDASEIPIEIKPEVKGQWRWLDTSTLALMLDDKNALSHATRYDITVKPGIKAEDGVTLKNTIRQTFIPLFTGIVFKSICPFSL
jgi:alpha-2-macroglobulin